MKIILTLMLLALSACTTIKLTDSQGSIKIERSFGFASISPSNNSGAVTAQITSFGYILTPLGQNIGYSNHSILLSDSSCKVVVWLDDSLTEEEMAELKKINSICIKHKD